MKLVKIPSPGQSELVVNADLVTHVWADSSNNTALIYVAGGEKPVYTDATVSDVVKALSR